MKALIVHHPYTRPRFEQDFLDRLAALDSFELAPADLDALLEGRLAHSGVDLNLNRFDAVLVFVAFNRLRSAAPLLWRGYSGLRVMFEHDAIQNYSDIFDPALFGAWPDAFRRHAFDLMVTSGGVVRERLAQDGVAAEWLPKAFEPNRFLDADGERGGVVTYGSAYRCRAIAERAITEADLPLDRLPMTAYAGLGAVLSRYLACLAISSDLLVPLELRPALDGAPAISVPMKPGLEPMAKFFEAAGAGCCPVADAMEDLSVLGFADGVNAITFRTHDELVEQLRYWLSRPAQLRELGRAAAKLAHENHTWVHRAAELQAILQRRLAR